jgi:DNA-directed RNA polymerase specialized sigma24 family protein
VSKPAATTAQSDKVARDRAFEADALPWIDAVYQLALSLTRDEAAASDVVEDTFLRAYEAWHTYVPGSDCRRWLLAICRDVVLRSRDDASPLAPGAPERHDALAAARAFWARADDGGRDDAPARRIAPRKREQSLPSPPPVRAPDAVAPRPASWVVGPFVRVVPFPS